MQFINRDEKQSFEILAGTPETFTVDWPVGAYPLGPWGQKVYEALLVLRNMFTQKAPPNVALVDGVILGWLYQSVEVKALRADNEELRKRLGKLEHDLANVQQTVASLVSNAPGRNP